MGEGKRVTKVVGVGFGLLAADRKLCSFVGTK